MFATALARLKGCNWRPFLRAFSGERKSSATKKNAVNPQVKAKKAIRVSCYYSITAELLTSRSTSKIKVVTKASESVQIIATNYISFSSFSIQKFAYNPFGLVFGYENGNLRGKALLGSRQRLQIIKIEIKPSGSADNKLIIHRTAHCVELWGDGGHGARQSSFSHAKHSFDSYLNHNLGDSTRVAGVEWAKHVLRFES